MDGIRTQIINFQQICRICLHENGILTEIFGSKMDDNYLTLDQKIMACASVNLCKGDGLPARICVKCLSNLNAAFEFKIQCENANKTLQNIKNLLISIKTEEHDDTNDDEKESNSEKQTRQDFNSVIIIDKHESIGLDGCNSDFLNVINNGMSNDETQGLKGNVNFSEVKLSRHSVPGQGFSIESAIMPPRKTDSLLLTSCENSEEECRLANESKIVQVKINEFKSKIREKNVGKLLKMPCPFCNKMIARVDEHIRLLHRNRVYVCTKHGCGAEFSTLKNLQSHHLNCYNLKKAYKCTKCFKEFHRKSNFKAHIKRHTDKKDFECQLCDRAFVDSTGLRRHFLKHHEPEQELFVSSCCGKSFKSKEGLKKHIKRSICGIQIFQVTGSD